MSHVPEFVDPPPAQMHSPTMSTAQAAAPCEATNAAPATPAEGDVGAERAADAAKDLALAGATSLMEVEPPWLPLWAEPPEVRWEEPASIDAGLPLLSPPPALDAEGAHEASLGVPAGLGFSVELLGGVPSFSAITPAPPDSDSWGEPVFGMQSLAAMPQAQAFWHGTGEARGFGWTSAILLQHVEPPGRQHRRRGARSGPTPVTTEQPIDSPAMAAVVKRLRQFGLREFRPGQERVVRNVLARRDTLAVMPTGSGKSLTFQLPGMVLEGVTIVVSPLLALMKDQTDKLRKRGIQAARLDSTISAALERETLQGIEEGLRKLVYVTPERVSSPDFKDELGGRPVSLFVIDEAHCVSQWGHDFRPSYLNLKRAIAILGNPPVLALTATATPRVVADIQERLALRQPEVVHLGFARPELIFEVRSVSDEKQQVRRLLRLVRRIRGSGIVYASTIATVDALAGALNRLGMRVGKYHGKMSKEERDTEQHRFMKNQARVMIATNAFGLGVDKPDIRFVIHYNLPGSVEQYYQEAGRAGRDGRPARCVLLWRPGDEEVQKHFNIQKYPGRDQVRSVAKALRAGPGKLEEIALRAGVPQKKTQVVLAMFEESALARELPGSIWSPADESADEATVWRAAEAYRKKREGDRERLQAMLDYAEARRCRVQFLLGYFGEEAPACSRCDNCTGRHGADDDDDDDLENHRARPLPAIPEAPPPPRKNPTQMF